LLYNTFSQYGVIANATFSALKRLKRIAYNKFSVQCLFTVTIFDILAEATD